MFVERPLLQGALKSRIKPFTAVASLYEAPPPRLYLIDLGRDMNMLTPREEQVLSMLANKADKKTIADALDIFPEEVILLRREIFNSLHVQKEKQDQFLLNYPEAVRKRDKWLKKTVAGFDYSAVERLSPERKLIFDEIGSGKSCAEVREVLGKSGEIVNDHVVVVGNEFRIDLDKVGKNRRFWLRVIWQELEKRKKTQESVSEENI